MDNDTSPLIILMYCCKYSAYEHSAQGATQSDSRDMGAINRPYAIRFAWDWAR